jgi:type II secretory pathway pseudopilin PulG
MAKLLLKSLWREERGFSIFEIIIAVFILGTAGVAAVSLMTANIGLADRAEENVTLLQLARAQIETIQQSPFKQDPTTYPAISGIPEGFAVTVSATDSGLTYTYPAPLGTTITNVVQKIVVIAKGDYSELTLTFYKLRSP